MPESVWKSIDETAEKEDLSANQVIRRIVNLWLTGFLVKKERKAIAPSRPAWVRKSAQVKDRRESAAITLWYQRKHNN